MSKELLSITPVGRYHLNIQVRLPPGVYDAKLRCYFLKPVTAAEGGDAIRDEFFTNLLEEHRIGVSAEEVVDGNHLIDQINRTAMISTGHGVIVFKHALANLTRHVTDLSRHPSWKRLKEANKLLSSLNKIDNFHRLARMQRRRIELANQILYFEIHQGALRTIQSTKCSANEIEKVKRLLEQVKRNAEQGGYRISANKVKGRERLFKRLQAARKVVDSPYKTKVVIDNSPAYVQQVLIGLSAALAMAFATGIAFATQQAFGNFTTPFFFALVVSYILKDRIKEVGRGYLLNKYFGHFSQRIKELQLAKTDDPLVTIAEAVQSKTVTKLPRILTECVKHIYPLLESNNNPVLLYRRSYRRHTASIEGERRYIRDRLTLNLSRRLRLYADQMWPYLTMGDDEVEESEVHRTRAIPVAALLTIDGKSHVQGLTLSVSRVGIHRVEQNYIMDE